MDNGTQSNCPLTVPPLGGQFAGSGNEIDLSLPLGHEKLILSRLSSVSFYCYSYWDILGYTFPHYHSHYLYNYLLARAGAPTKIYIDQASTCNSIFSLLFLTLKTIVVAAVSVHLRGDGEAELGEAVLLRVHDLPQNLPPEKRSG